MRGKISRDEGGQSALFDAVMFLIVMIIASSLIQIYSSQYSKDVELITREDMMDYTRETAEVVFGATLNSTWYEDIQGDIIEKPPGDTTVLNLILEELYLLDEGVQKHNFVLGFENDIKVLLRNLVNPVYHFALQGTFFNESKNQEYMVFISDIVPDYQLKEEATLDHNDYVNMIPRSDLTSTGFTLPMIGKSGEARVSFSLWP
ncbi:MAG: hypothetical protein JSV56_10515 [Methanomassiliicoccales archaeon]|nr:MAG: hypothetical protein JSV56_10515 [Methanomassiliicoccales archaeon]